MTPNTIEEIVTALKALQDAARALPGILGQRVPAIIETTWIRVLAADQISKNNDAGQLMPFKAAL